MNIWYRVSYRINIWYRVSYRTMFIFIIEMLVDQKNSMPVFIFDTFKLLNLLFILKILQIFQRIKGGLNVHNLMKEILHWWHGRFSAVPFKALSDQVWIRYLCFCDWKLYIFNCGFFKHISCLQTLQTRKTTLSFTLLIRSRFQRYL